MELLNGNQSIYSFNIHPLILTEIDSFVEKSKQIKLHPLAYLKAHENAGYLSLDGKKHNSYQCSVPRELVENSFWLAWTLRLVDKIWNNSQYHRIFRLRTYPGHFDTCDLWTNFSYKGDDNPIHCHSGFVSGVIYYKNHGHPTIFDECGLCHSGKDGTMILFPSSVYHHVDKQELDTERITLAFNIEKI